MTPEQALLQLISDLYIQIKVLAAENQELKDQAAKNEPKA